MIWQVWIELRDSAGAYYWQPYQYEADTAEAAVDWAISYYDPHRLQVGWVLRRVMVAPKSECQDFQLERSPLPMFRRAANG